MNLPGAVSNARLPERVRQLGNVVNFHYAGAGLLLLLNLVLAVRLGFAWHTTSDSGAEALAQSQLALRTADLQARPLQGLDSKLAAANVEADTFYTRRLPGSYSAVLAELGAETKRQGVKLGRVQYAQAPVLNDTAAALTEMRMDASLTGDYRSLVHFINSMERDRMFFFITGVALTGQQAGSVGLRLRLNTYLRPGAMLDADPSTAEIPGGATPVGSVSATGNAAPASTNPAAAQDGGRRLNTPGAVIYSEGGQPQ